MIKNLEEQIEAKCRFCNPPEKDRIIFESSNFYVMLSLGPIVEGYSLIVSKSHLDCSGIYNKELGEEFDRIANSLKTLMIQEYGSCLFYEHGRAGSCLQLDDGSKHCYHAHMHCIPTDIKLNEIICKDFAPKNIDSWEGFRFDYQMKFSPYLFVDDGQKTIYYVDKPIRRQYLRFHLANEIGSPELWDWVKFQGWDKITTAQTKLNQKIII
ncbi:MAG: hypothetical protein R2787_03800 [Saprospiraceae bacterium]